MDDLLVISEIKNSKDLRSLAQKKTNEILQRINETDNQIELARNDTINAKNINGLFKGKDRDIALAESQLKQIDAMHQMNALIRDSISLTCYTAEFAKLMSETLSVAMVNGFEDYDGKIKPLSESSRRQAKIIKESAELFVERTIETDNRLSECENKISEFSSFITSTKEELEILRNARNSIESKLDEVSTLNEKNLISINELISNKKDVETVNEKINRLESGLSSAENKFNSIDFRMEEKIQSNLSNLLKIYATKDEIEEKIRTFNKGSSDETTQGIRKNNPLPIVLSCCSILINIGLLIFLFIK